MPPVAQMQTYKRHWKEQESSLRWMHRAGMSDLSRATKNNALETLNSVSLSSPILVARRTNNRKVVGSMSAKS